jgi:hypothetical protein
LILAEVTPGYRILSELINLYQRRTSQHREPPEIPFPHLPPEDAARRFKFDFGNPQDGTAYLLNPCDTKHYLLPALADERLVQEKAAAFVEISAALGAKKLELVFGSLDSTAANAGANLRTVAAQAGLSASFQDDHRVNRQVYMEFAQPPGPPHLPQALELWPAQDPLLRAVVNTRLRRRLHRAQVSLKLSQASNLSSELTGVLRGQGINVGGTYKQVFGSSWDFEVEFWPSMEQDRVAESQKEKVSKTVSPGRRRRKA